MNCVYEEDGVFKVASIMADQGASLQLETPTGKRFKVKSNQLLMRFKDAELQTLIPRAQALVDNLDMAFLWECAPQEEFEFTLLAATYFGDHASVVEQVAMLLALHAAPLYFHRKGRGKYRPAPPDILQAALAAVEKKRLLQIQQEQWVEEIKAGKLPNWSVSAAQLLFAPDKNSMAYKALHQATTELNTTPAKILLTLGCFKRDYDLHLQQFLYQNFPKGREFRDVPLPNLDLLSQLSIPEVSTPAFSLDDQTTTEIDDAFSVESTDTGWTIGIHIAAPSLLIQRGDVYDKIAASRYSTVYMPGDKITMLPNELVELFTLQEGKQCYALSLYANLDHSYQITHTYTQVNRVHIAQNLRTNVMDTLVSEQDLDDQTGDYPFAKELSVLWQAAKHLSQARDQVRGKPENNNRIDYNFYVTDEVVTITPRMRHAPLDRLVAEWMIFANSTWGKLLADHKIPGIYRGQHANRVRMTTYPAPHLSIGVAQYAWSTSPLRRYVDLVNQWQLLSCVLPNQAPAFKPLDSELMAVIAGFDAAYGAYAEFQEKMEHYWCLRWLEQHQTASLEASVLKDGILRATNLPLIIRLPSLINIQRGAIVRVEINKIDTLNLQLDCRYLETLSDHGLCVADDSEADEQVTDQQTIAELPPVSQSVEQGVLPEATQSSS